VGHRRRIGLPTLSDSEVYRAFDLTYDYDIWPIWQAAVVGQVPVSRYLEMLCFQECIYPGNHVKMRCAENHDQLRIMRLAPSRGQALAWTAFQAMNRGAFLIYAGQESAAHHTPSLFEVDRVEWGHYELAPFLTTLGRLKKDPAQTHGQFVLLSAEPAIQATWVYPGAGLYGIFNVTGASGSVPVQLADGDYPDLLSGATMAVRRGNTALPASAVILRYEETIPFRPLHTELLDFHPGRESE